MTPPDCDLCDARHTLQPVGRPDAAGEQWHTCSCCAKSMVVDREGRIVRHAGERRRGTFVGGGSA